MAEETGRPLSKMRWFILTIFCLLLGSQQVVWITYAPISPLIQDFYGVSSFAVNCLSMIFMLIFLPGAPIASHLTNRLSLKSGITIGAIFNASGALLRILPYPFTDGSGSLGFAFAFLGQTLESIGQSFTYAMPPCVAQNWFGEHERVTATALGTMATQYDRPRKKKKNAKLRDQLGVALGLVMPSWVVQSDVPPEDTHIPLLMIIQAAMCVSALVLVLIFFKSRPMIAPSASSEKNFAKEPDIETSMWRSIFNGCRDSFRSPGFTYLFVSFGLIFGGIYAIATVQGDALSSLGYSEVEIGVFGMLMTLAGVAGALLWGVLGDRTRRYKILIMIACALSVVSIGGYTLSLTDYASDLSFRSYLVATASIVLGFFVTALMPISLDTSVEICYPMPDVWPTNVLVISAQFFGMVEIIVMTVLIEYNVVAAHLLLVGIFIIATVVAAFLNVRTLRLNDEQEAEKANSEIRNTESGERKEGVESNAVEVNEQMAIKNNEPLPQS